MDEDLLIVTTALICAGLVAGFIDAIAGGGGLITIPVFSFILGVGPHAIGTNKIAGTVAALVALVVYARGKHFDWRRSLGFTLWVALGSWTGSRVAVHIPVDYFKYFLALTCPLVLYVVWRKDFWAKEAQPGERPHYGALVASGLACGFYDGVWGTGGGTFMFLSLLFFVKLPIFTALAAAKFANTCSAGTALLGYSLGGFVHWREGLTLSAGIGAGAFLGARHATQKNAQVIRPVLALVAVILLSKLLFQF